MSTEKLKAEAMALPIAERVSLALALWESVDSGLPDTEDSTALTDAIRRDSELSSGQATPRTNEEVIVNRE